MKNTFSILFAAAEVVSASPMLELPNHGIRQHLINQMLGATDVFRMQPASSHPRKIEETACPGTPFLWKIIEDESGKHVGFGVGTMHLPAELILTEEAYASILSAVEDSCNIYGELNLLDPQVKLDVQGCLALLAHDAATVADIQDDDVRLAYEKELEDIAMMLGTFGADESTIDTVYEALLALPLFNAQQLISYSNTPEYDDYTLMQRLTGQAVPALDDALLSLGRIPGGIEQVSTQCDVLEDLYPTPEELNPLSLALSLNQTLSEQINIYKCGDIYSFVSFFESLEMVGYEEDPEFEDAILDDRNEDMAAAIAKTLETNDKKVIFAFGAAHWVLGDNSLDILLKDYGYSLEYAPAYGQDDAVNKSDEECGVVYNRLEGVFELIGTSNSTSSTNSTELASTETSNPYFQGTTALTPTPEDDGFDLSNIQGTSTPSANPIPDYGGENPSGVSESVSEESSSYMFKSSIALVILLSFVSVSNL